MRSIRIHKTWPVGIDGVEIVSCGKSDQLEYDYGMIMNGGRIIPIEEVGQPPLAHYAIKSDKEFKEWLIQLRADGFWKKLPNILTNADFAQCANQQYIKFAYERYKILH